MCVISHFKNYLKFCCTLTGLPTLDDEPDLKDKVIDKTFTLECKWKPLPVATRTYHYTVTWYINDVELLSNNRNATTSDSIEEKDIPLLKYGDQVQ